jgi:hypothetical protein
MANCIPTPHVRERATRRLLSNADCRTVSPRRSNSNHGPAFSATPDQANLLWHLNPTTLQPARVSGLAVGTVFMLLSATRIACFRRLPLAMAHMDEQPATRIRVDRDSGTIGPKRLARALSDRSVALVLNFEQIFPVPGSQNWTAR